MNLRLAFIIRLDILLSMDAIRAAFGDFVSFLPDLVAGALVLAIGWGVAVLVSLGIRRLLPRLGFDRFLARHRLMDRPPAARAGSRVVGAIAAWVVFLAALMQAASIWGLNSLAAGLGRVLAYLPNIIAAVLIFGGAWVVGNWVGGRVRSSLAEERPGAGAVSTGSAILPGAVRAGILTIGAFVALRQLLIASEILVIAFALVFGGIAVAAALAFGLGGRRAAERMTTDWYERQHGPSREAHGAAEGVDRGDQERPGVH